MGLVNLFLDAVVMVGRVLKLFNSYDRVLEHKNPLCRLSINLCYTKELFPNHFACVTSRLCASNWARQAKAP